MTRPVLVMDGNEVKLRLQAERRHSGGLVHVDWLRFTCELRYAPVPQMEVLFPSPVADTLENPRSIAEVEHANYRRAKMFRILRDMPDVDFAASAQAHALAQKVCKCLGPEFSIEPELKKGHDFYRFRWSIIRNDAEVAWVGFLASGDSPRQQAQAKTIHANIYGSACTFARGDWRHRMANLIEEVEGKLTRIDYALDFFDGIRGGLERIRDDWHAGLMDVNGRRPKANTVGPWVDGGRGRSFYFGSKEAGKQTNVYEKGVQLFGELDATNWERVELRYGNKLRDLPVDMLRRPEDFFAGASDWHQKMLAEHGEYNEGEGVKVRPKQAIESVRAEVTRAVRWLTNTAGASVALAFEFLGADEFMEIVTGRKKPGRLSKFSNEEIRAACAALNPQVFQPKVRSIGLPA
ncbi:replication initiation factor domain-containing protein [Comamonas terrae]|uniref:Replication initiation factor domain-containing protein n=1 Tax=Comamonas terrae TaxID=673548 RepID=A0ABW5UPT2_9BURK|nr:replication initiation factor domain-containing protein [Comamonas terrae]